MRFRVEGLGLRVEGLQIQGDTLQVTSLIRLVYGAHLPLRCKSPRMLVGGMGVDLACDCSGTRVSAVGAWTRPQDFGVPSKNNLVLRSNVLPSKALQWEGLTCM